MSCYSKTTCWEEFLHPVVLCHILFMFILCKYNKFINCIATTFQREKLAGSRKRKFHITLWHKSGSLKIYAIKPQTLASVAFCELSRESLVQNEWKKVHVEACVMWVIFHNITIFSDIPFSGVLMMVVDWVEVWWYIHIIFSIIKPFSGSSLPINRGIVILEQTPLSGQVNPNHASSLHVCTVLLATHALAHLLRIWWKMTYMTIPVVLHHWTLKCVLRGLCTAALL